MDRLTIEVLPNVTKDAPDWLDELQEIVTNSIKAHGWYARISAGKKQTFIEVSKFDTKTAVEILDSISTIAKEFGISPTAILDQLGELREKEQAENMQHS